jgi:methylthioribose-1-phosphate isomerase
MKVNGTHHRSIQRSGAAVQVVDQRSLPHVFRMQTLSSVGEVADAIRDMTVRGAPLIGVAAAYGMALAMQVQADDGDVSRAASLLVSTRPTAINLRWAVEAIQRQLLRMPAPLRPAASWQLADELAESDVLTNQRIGAWGAGLLRQRWLELGQPARLEVLTHCNAGWLGCVDWGTALAAIYQAHDSGVPVHVWVDETRPRNQGALTCWELARHGVPATLVADNAGGLLMQQGRVHACMVGADRVTTQGDVCNKVGTYLKALAARAHGIPFYVALPLSTVDWTIQRGEEIDIEYRAADEVTHVSGRNAAGHIERVQLAPDGTLAENPAFDITPAACVSALVTELGVIEASERGLASLQQYRKAA